MEFILLIWRLVDPWNRCSELKYSVKCRNKLNKIGDDRRRLWSWRARCVDQEGAFSSSALQQWTLWDALWSMWSVKPVVGWHGQCGGPTWIMWWARHARCVGDGARLAHCRGLHGVCCGMTWVVLGVGKLEIFECYVISSILVSI